MCYITLSFKERKIILACCLCLLFQYIQKDGSVCVEICCFTLRQRTRCESHGINSLSPNSDQHQFSPNNIHRLSSATSMRINQMITKRKISDLLLISPNRNIWRICLWILGLKGLIHYLLDWVMVIDPTSQINWCRV